MSDRAAHCLLLEAGGPTCNCRNVQLFTAHGEKRCVVHASEGMILAQHLRYVHGVVVVLGVHHFGNGESSSA